MTESYLKLTAYFGERQRVGGRFVADAGAVEADSPGQVLVDAANQLQDLCGGTSRCAELARGQMAEAPAGRGLGAS